MKILVAVVSYSEPNKKSPDFYIQVRNLYYKKKGIDVYVLNFASSNDYIIDDTPVYSLKTYKEKLQDARFDLLVIHQSNLRNHYLFLKKYEKNFPRIIFFYHGHEVLNCNKVYSKPYPYMSKIPLYKVWGQELYDSIKLKLWHNYLPKIKEKSYFVYVSHWMYDEFLHWTRVPEILIRDRVSITYNCVGEAFETLEYDLNTFKSYDFITIRTNLDGSKYAIDVVNQLAKNNPQFRFLLIGKGDFFKYNEKAENLEWRDMYLTHKEIINVLNSSRCALMPTRTDAQGLMMCEMATFGIPVITSDISICHEVFDDFDNVEMINIDKLELVNLSQIINKLVSKVPYIKNSKYFSDNTTAKEVVLFHRILQDL